MLNLYQPDKTSKPAQPNQLEKKQMRDAKRATISTTPSATIAGPSVERPTSRCVSTTRTAIMAVSSPQRPTVRCSRTGSAAKESGPKAAPSGACAARVCAIASICGRLCCADAAPPDPLHCGSRPFPRDACSRLELCNRTCDLAQAHLAQLHQPVVILQPLVLARARQEECELRLLDTTPWPL